MNKQLVATVISRIFDPVVSLFVVFMALFYGLPEFIWAFLLMIVVPFVLFIIAWKTKFIGNWDVSDRRERPKILWTLVGVEILSMVILRSTIALPVLIALIGFAIITHFWKISGHAMAAALATGVLVSRFGWTWWPVFCIVPIVGWARVVRKDHTISQVTAGVAYSWILLVIFDYWIIR